MKYFIIATHHTRIKCILHKIYGIDKAIVKDKHLISNLGLVFIRPDGKINIINPNNSSKNSEWEWDLAAVARQQSVSEQSVRDMTVIMIRHGYGQHNRDKDQWRIDPSGTASFIVKFFNYMYHEPRLVLDKNDFTKASTTIKHQLQKQSSVDSKVYFCSSPMVRCIQTISCIYTLLIQEVPQTKKSMYDDKIYILPNIHEVGGLKKCKQSLNSWWAMSENRSQLKDKTDQQRQQIETQVLSGIKCSQNKDTSLKAETINWAPFNNLSSNSFLDVLHQIATS